MAAIEIGKQLSGILNAYQEGLVKDISEAGVICAQGALQDVKSGSPHLSGIYRKSWKMSTQRNYATNIPSHTVHNKKRYQLSHLLEKPHSGPYGRGTVAGRPHIEPAAKKWTGKYVKMCEEAASK